MLAVAAQRPAAALEPRRVPAMKPARFRALLAELLADESLAQPSG